MRLIISIVLTLVLFVSCSNNGVCREDLDIGMYANLYKMVYDEGLEKMTAKSYPVQINVKGVGVDSVIYDSEVLSELYLPLQKFADTTSFALQTTFLDEDSIVKVFDDTIHIYHTNREEFVSLECGCLITNTINSVAITTNLIDSVIIDNAEVISATTSNIKIYLKEQ